MKKINTALNEFLWGTKDDSDYNGLVTFYGMAIVAVCTITYATYVNLVVL